MVEFLLGIDGGGTSTRAVVARREGRAELGRGMAGPSALGQGVAQAWRHIEEASRRAFAAAGLPWPGWERCAMVAGLSGVSNPPWRDAFVVADPGLAFLEAETDSFVMLLGAHGGPGAILAAGTGSVGEALRPDGSRFTVGGWGFPVGDEGSGSWLGLHAVRQAQAALDGRERNGPLVQHIWQRCGAHRDELQAWCDGAGQFAYAQLAPAVFEYEEADATARLLLERAAGALERIAHALDPDGSLPLAVAGSIATRLAPRFAPGIHTRLVAPAHDPAAGALMLARRLLHQEMEAVL